MTPDAADMEACAAAIRGGSKTFFAASLLLPRPTRLGAYAIYAFCRYSDDAIDVAAGNRAALDNLRRRLALIYEGRPIDHFADRAFADVAARYSIPIDLPAALLDGFAWDVEQRRYETLADLEDYAARVAGSVGAIMACLMGARSREALARATDLGAAMQLTNIARDVGEDARNGRIYLPLAAMAQQGCDPAAFLATPEFSPAIGAIVKDLLARAATLYQRGAAGIGFLPGDCRAAISAAGVIYADIGREIGAAGHDSVTSRAVVSTSRKLALLAIAVAGVRQDRSLRNLPPLEANRFLVEAACSSTSALASPPSLDDQIAGVIDLLARLERRERVQGAPAY